MTRLGEAFAGAFVAHVVFGIAWFVLLGSLLVVAEAREAFWAGVGTWAALFPILVWLAWRHLRWWRYGVEAAWLLAWAVVTAIVVAGAL